MLDPRCIIFIVGFLCLARVLDASAGDADPIYRTCTGECERRGCVGETCFTPCKYLLDHSSTEAPWYMQKPLYLLWKQLDCKSECRYHCMMEREKERAVHLGPVKYHGKWPFQRLFGFQEPVSVVFSFLNLAAHFYGWLCYFILIYYKLPLKHDKPYYDFAGLWHIYGLLSMNSWFWSAVFHSREVEFTERLDYSSAVALLGFSLILSLIRSIGIKDEAGRVMVSAPLIAFTTTHILYLNNFRMDYGMQVPAMCNMTFCVPNPENDTKLLSLFAQVGT
ncbi:OLC1v1022218C1 [Oldenlandia corymbosa var. corymbosa]|uniref:Post-GPI attachment to proteins factor 3 n=1 Tax=Oldenlandia corymbosa var. corymbosa TaxID=529605 RepID=A0AAV1BXD2_OLDCO|nr:OLC1v1022218C1 [Oldenlandia corymbosa var. corymbosa]